MSVAASIYLENLGNAQREFVKHINEQFRRNGNDLDNYIAPNAEQFINSTIKRWLDGERIELGSNDSPRDLTSRDALLAHLSNPGHSGCQEQEFALALLLPSMVERVLDAGADTEAITVKVSTFFNCRENGLVYTVEQPDGMTRSFSVYEHRNSDSIIINGCANWDGASLPYASDSAHVFFAELSCGNYEQAADALTFFITNAARGELAGNIELVNSCEHLDWGAIISKSIPEFGQWLEDKGVKPLDRMREQ